MESAMVPKKRGGRRRKMSNKKNVDETYIEELLAQLTLEEKIGMIHGATLFHTAEVERLGIPALHMSDGPCGVRFEHLDNEWVPVGLPDDYVSYLPCNSATVSTWNRQLAHDAGAVLGEETRGRGKDVILGPGINIKRSPLCGRNFEYMSEDPRLIEEMVVPLVQGIQEHDVSACAKHFAVNSQETERIWVDTIVDERTLHEIYYPGFQAAIEKGGLYSLMSAYNRLNGEHCGTSKCLLNNVLRKEWGYDGMIVSDWGGVHDTVLAAESAMDIEMDVIYDFENHHMANPLLEKIRSGELSEALVDEKVRNILRLMLRLKMIGPERENRKTGTYNSKEHQEAVLAVAEESLILLKNEEQLLPLDAKKVGKVAVIGANAVKLHANGGGSAEIKALYEIAPLTGIKQLLGGNGRVAYAPGYFVPKKGGRAEISWQAASTESPDDVAGSASSRRTPDMVTPEERAKYEQEYLEEAVELAKNSDTVIFVGGLNHDYDVEGLDREDMVLPYHQDKLIGALLEVNPNTVIVMYAGSPVEMPWLSQAKSVLWSYYAGMEGGTAIAKTLFGEVNPSGKLAETFIQTADQCPAKLGVNFGLKDRVVYDEGTMVGYRYYNTHDVDVNFCFGHGLSYTEYAYSNLHIEEKLQEEKVICVAATITNTGAVAGKEVVQVYVNGELKAFDKVALAAGESKQVQFCLNAKDFSTYDVNKKDFVVAHGVYELQVAASSRDIRLVGEIEY